MTQFNASAQTLAQAAVSKACVDTGKAISTGWGALIPLWRMRARSRAALRHLTAEQLTDIGISSTAAQREGAKWFWQA